MKVVASLFDDGGESGVRFTSLREREIVMVSNLVPWTAVARESRVFPNIRGGVANQWLRGRRRAARGERTKTMREVNGKRKKRENYMAYCTIDGVPTDVLISGIPDLNRAVSLDLFAI
ncbi:hypothetical protein RIF29_23989 [Crotalaria pallida]|uniref:Uncharacterized protein n=1 Tax=Crotalaria pallida TaxID=3830 RepID=A0AAN9HYG8_CROPI